MAPTSTWQASSYPGSRGFLCLEPSRPPERRLSFSETGNPLIQGSLQYDFDQSSFQGLFMTACSSIKCDNFICFQLLTDQNGIILHNSMVGINKCFLVDLAVSTMPGTRRFIELNGFLFENYNATTFLGGNYASEGQAIELQIQRKARVY